MQRYSIQQKCHAHSNTINIQRREDNFMKKKLITLLLVSALTVSGCGDSDTPAANAPAETEAPAAETPENESSEADSENISELDSLGDVEVEQQLFDVTITIPADYVESTTQEELVMIAITSNLIPAIRF